jgi:hypothetical protein
VAAVCVVDGGAERGSGLHAAGAVGEVGGWIRVRVRVSDGDKCRGRGRGRGGVSG